MTAHIRVDNNIDNLESHCKSRNSNIPIEVNTTWINMISQFKIINNMLIQHHIIYIYDLVCSCTRDLSPAQNTSIKNSCEYPASERHHFHADKIYAENDRFQLQMLGFARRFAGVLNCFFSWMCFMSASAAVSCVWFREQMNWTLQQKTYLFSF
jgi:hypothetical protein